MHAGAAAGVTHHRRRGRHESRQQLLCADALKDPVGSGAQPIVFAKAVDVERADLRSMARSVPAPMPVTLRQLRDLAIGASYQLTARSAWV